MKRKEIKNRGERGKGNIGERKKGKGERNKRERGKGKGEREKRLTNKLIGLPGFKNVFDFYKFRNGRRKRGGRAGIHGSNESSFMQRNLGWIFYFGVFIILVRGEFKTESADNVCLYWICMGEWLERNRRKINKRKKEIGTLSSSKEL